MYELTGTIMYKLTINGQIIYVIDGYFYTLDTIPIANLFDSISI